MCAFAQKIPERLSGVLDGVLEAGETLVYVQSNQKGTEAYVLTDQRLLRISFDKVAESIPLSTIKHVDVAGVRIPGRTVQMPERDLEPGFRITVESQPKELYFTSSRGWEGGSMAASSGYAMGEVGREWLLRFPMELCEQCGLQYAPHTISRKPNGTVVDYAMWFLEDGFKPVWPQKCASCMNPVEDPAFDEKFIKGSSIPYCRNCYQERFGRLKKNRAVEWKENTYLFRRSLRFENLEYARAFAAVNFERTYHDLIDSEEELVFAQSNAQGNKAYVFTDQRMLHIHFNQVQASIPLSGITRVESSVIKPEDTTKAWSPGFRITADSHPDGLLFHSSPPYFGQFSLAEPWKWMQQFPKLLSEQCGLEYRPLELVSQYDRVSKQNGILVEGMASFAHTYGLAWPQGQCVSCMKRVDEPIVDKKAAIGAAGSKVTPFGYCKECHNERFGPWKTQQAAKVWEFRSLWFANADYVEELVRLNFD